MESKEIHKLLDAIAQSGLDEVSIETADFKISAKRNPVVAVQQVAISAASMPAIAPAPVAAAVSAPAVAAAPASAPAPTPAATNTVMIKSPMIGTFYASAKPGEPAFLNVGDEIKTGKVVCIIEAMKLFNEIESEVSGRVVRVLVNDKTPVEFDQALFEIEPM
jgi:acetyl-CoA carboxylase biotin carboxyl carrier protein